MAYKMPEWRSHLAGSLHRSRAKPDSRYFQLATVSLEGLPKNRTVVFRGFLESSNQIQIITDSRSEKVSQIAHQSRGEICWYFSKTKEQFRLSGNLLVIDSQSSHPDFINARKVAWQKISDNARAQFAWPKPGSIITDNPNASAPITPSDQEPLSNFCLLLFTPQKIDHLRLQGEPHNRCLHQLQPNGDWTVELINP